MTVGAPYSQYRARNTYVLKVHGLWPGDTEGIVQFESMQRDWWSASLRSLFMFGLGLRVIAALCFVARSNHLGVRSVANVISRSVRCLAHTATARFVERPARKKLTIMAYSMGLEFSKTPVTMAASV